MPATDGSVRGTVTAFDDPRGLGVVTTADGRELAFHCTAVADGTRTIAVGTEVAVQIGPGLPGRWEAVVVDPSAHA